MRLEGHYLLASLSVYDNGTVLPDLEGSLAERIEARDAKKGKGRKKKKGRK
jgi:hypothetical protein